MTDRKAYNEAYYLAHREELKNYSEAYRQTHKEEILAHARRYRAKNRQKALAMIASHWGDESPRCRFDTLPEGHPLKEHDCWGALEIDHIHGGGQKDHRLGGDPVTKIANGKRDIADFRLLCRLHQLWNNERVRGRPVLNDTD